MPNFDLRTIQKAIKDTKLNGWLFYDFHGSDPIGKRILNLSLDINHTRRWYYYIPAQGVPVKLVHSIERDVLDHLPGKKIVYLGWQEMEDKLRTVFKIGDKIAVQYSPKNAIPYISRMDAGTFELLKSFKVKLLSSADLVQKFEACLTQFQLNTHINAAKLLNNIVQKTFQIIKQKIGAHEEINEFIIQQFMIDELKNRGLYYDQAPIVAANQNSGNPHYTPSQENNSPIYPGSLIQLDIWAKENNDNAIYADISWVGYVGNVVPDEQMKIFNIIKTARDRAVDFIDISIKSNKIIYGWQVDDIARNIINDAGYGSYFLHRTGHSIGRDLHANGVNIDNLETKDERKIIPGTCFSIEPGIYFSKYGMRTEIDVYVDENGAHVFTQPVQENIVAILA
jgi:Xaa-Pro dipeptidase